MNVFFFKMSNDDVLYIHLTNEPCLFGSFFVSCDPVCAVDVPSLRRPLTRMVTLLNASIESCSKLPLFRFGWRPSSNNPSFSSPWVSKKMTCGMFSPMIILSNYCIVCFPSCLSHAVKLLVQHNTNDLLKESAVKKHSMEKKKKSNAFCRSLNPLSYKMKSSLKEPLLIRTFIIVTSKIHFPNPCTSNLQNTPTKKGLLGEDHPIFFQFWKYDHDSNMKNLKIKYRIHL